MAVLHSAQRFFSMESESGKRRWTEDDKDESNWQANILAVLNFLEEIAGEYRDGLLDRSVADRSVALIAVGAWKQAEWFALWVREMSSQDQAWGELQGLAQEWENRPAVRVTGWRRPDTFFQSPHI